MGEKKRTMVNVLASIVALACNLLISFWLSPFLITHIGVEANGFVTLANNFVTYAGLIVTALNSMASRYITIAYVRRDMEKAQLYYNSVFWGNLIIVGVLLGPSILLITRLDHFINVPAGILFDVKLLFAAVFLAFFLRTGFPNWDSAPYITNRMHRNYVPGIFVQLMRCAFLVLVFSFCVPHVYYVGYAGVLLAVMNLAVGAYNMHTLVPELRVKLGRDGVLCSRAAIRELVGSGIWNSISSIGNIMFTGVDLLVCNLFLGATAMGVVAVAKTLPSCVIQFARQIRWAVTPQLTQDYAKGDREAIKRNIRFAMRILCFFMTIPLAIIAVMGYDFYRLWVPTQDARTLYILSMLACGDYFLTSGCQVLYNVFLVVNKVKSHSIATIICGVASLLLTLLLVRFTDMGIYAVAGVSALLGLIRELVYTLPFAARYLGFRRSLFYPELLVTARSMLVLIAIGTGIHALLPCDTWPTMVLSVGVFGVLAMAANFSLLFDREEKRKVLELVRKRLGRA